MNWSRRFDDPVTLPDGRTISTMREAGQFITGLSDRVQRQDEWQLAIEMLMKVTEKGWPVMFAEIAFRRALDLPEPQRERKRAKKYRIVR